MKFNDLDLTRWQELDINTDSLWLFNSRDNTGKHCNVYHGNFIPQIPNQLIRRYTKPNELIFEPFMGSGTTLFECEKLGREYLGFDINSHIIEFVKSKMQISNDNRFHIIDCSALDVANFESYFSLLGKKAQFMIFHPPYMDIIRFTDHKDDLSQFDSINEFVKHFKIVCENSLRFLDKDRYFALVIGDVYKNSEVIPLSFYCMDMIKRNFQVKLKGIVIKNIEGNRGKLNLGGVWKYRALRSDYFIFKHEYIMLFKFLGKK